MAEPDQIKRTMDAIMVSAHEHYTTKAEHSALRCALGDAAHLCDVIAGQILEKGKGRRKVPTKAAKEAAAIASRCGDEIWAMRSMVGVTPKPEQPAAPAPAE